MIVWSKTEYRTWTNKAGKVYYIIKRNNGKLIESEIDLGSLDDLFLPFGSIKIDEDGNISIEESKVQNIVESSLKFREGAKKKKTDSSGSLMQSVETIRNIEVINLTFEKIVLLSEKIKGIEARQEKMIKLLESISNGDEL